MPCRQVVHVLPARGYSGTWLRCVRACVLTSLTRNLYEPQKIDGLESHGSVDKIALLGTHLPQGAAFLLDSLPRLLAELEVQLPSVPTPGLAERYTAVLPCVEVPLSMHTP